MTQRVFITGGASGIGEATAILFAQQGWKVGVSDVRLSDVERVCAAIGAAAEPFAVDVRNPSDIAVAIEAFCGVEGDLDFLFNSAGILDMRPFAETPLERLHQIIDVNVTGILNSVHVALPYLRRIAGARIISMSSASAMYGIPEEAAYSASKFAVRGLTEALNIEFEGLDIWVGDIMVAYVDTPMLSGAAHTAKSVENLGIHVTPNQVAQAVWDSLSKQQVHYFATSADHDTFARFRAMATDQLRGTIKGIAGY